MIKGPHYQIRDKVVSYGYMDHFTVDSDYGVFEVTGDGALRKLLKEINAIAVLRQIQGGAAYADALKTAGAMPLEFGEKSDHGSCSYCLRNSKRRYRAL